MSIPNDMTEQFDRAANPLEPDALLACQYSDRVRGGAYASGERRLMVAVLEDAIRCLQYGAADDKTDKRAQFRDARKWIASTDESWFFSFENVCETLGIDPLVLRRRLLDRECAGEHRQCRAVDEPAAAPRDPVCAS